MRNPGLFIHGWGTSKAPRFEAVQKLSGPPLPAEVVVTNIRGSRILRRPLKSWEPWRCGGGMERKHIIFTDEWLDDETVLKKGRYHIHLVTPAGESNMEHFAVHRGGRISWGSQNAVRLDFFSPRPFETRLGLAHEPDLLARVTNPKTADDEFYTRELRRAQLFVDGIPYARRPSNHPLISIGVFAVSGAGEQNSEWWSLDDWSLNGSDLTPGRHCAFLLFGGLRSNECVFEVHTG